MSRHTSKPVEPLELPPIGFGTYPQKESLRESIPAAIKCGYRLVDTSDNYLNDTFVGEGLSMAGKPDDVLVVTKFSNPYGGARRFDRWFKQSRDNVGGRVDLYLMHWPCPFLWKIVWRKMEKLVLSGQCKAIGVCNFERPMMEKLLRFCKIPPAVNQFERHPLMQQKETADFCREHGVRIMCYSPLARMDKRLMEHPTLVALAARHDKTVPQIILRWSIEHGDMPIPASRKEDHIKSNFDIFDFSLTPDEVREIDQLDEGYRIRFDPKKYFSFKDKVRCFKEAVRCILKGVKYDAR